MKERIRPGMEYKGARPLLGVQPHLALLLFGYRNTSPWPTRMQTQSHHEYTSRLRLEHLI